MTMFQNEVCRRRSVGVVLLAAGLLLLGQATAVEAALTTPSCLAKKLKEWGNLRKCQAIENAKALQAKPADPPKCQAKFDEKIAKLNAQATSVGIACRYANNGDGTVTDYDTGLQWEQKTNDTGVHGKGNLYTWGTMFAGMPDGTAFTAFLGRLNDRTSIDGTATTSGCFAGHCDWRLPAIEELAGIVDLAAPGCESGSPCIDQTVFGPTTASFYWSVSTKPGSLEPEAWLVGFYAGGVDYGSKLDPQYVRAVRSGL